MDSQILPDTVEKKLWLKDAEIEFCVSDMSLHERKDEVEFKGLDLQGGMYCDTCYNNHVSIILPTRDFS